MAPRSRLTYQTEQLIAEVKKYPCLYQVHHPHYMNMTLNYKCWREISKKLNRETSVLKKDWRTLLDCYRQVLITKGTKKRQTWLNLWRFEKHMMFVNR
ncbi:hypothetical protein TNIN_425231, partial [Trichonephila inaurata madagascariensis]